MKLGAAELGSFDTVTEQVERVCLIRRQLEMFETNALDVNFCLQTDADGRLASDPETRDNRNIQLLLATFAMKKSVTTQSVAGLVRLPLVQQRPRP